MRLDRMKFSAENCSIAGTLAAVGERWTFQILREAFNGLHRFDDFLTTVGCARNILSDRLARLVKEGIFEKVPYQVSGQRERFGYRLTPKGLDLFPVLIALMHWGDRWLEHKKGPPVIVLHNGCDSPIRLDIRCEKEHGGLTAREAKPIAGPGAIPLKNSRAKRNR